MVVEGLDVTVKEKYVILRDVDFLREYGPVKGVVELLENNLRNRNGEKTRRDIIELGIPVDKLGVEGTVGEYLSRLKQGDEKVRTHYGKLALMCRVL